MRAMGVVDEFAAVYDRHRTHVYAQCMRRLRSPADADDATQVTFLRAWSAIQRGNGPRLGAGPWLSTIARNVCADRLSDPKQAVPVDTDEMTIVDDGPAPDAGLVAEADGAEVRSALVHLPFAQRSALHLREVEELSYAEIGERLAMPVTAVETLLFRARGNLRDELQAVRNPVGCEQAKTLAAMVREGAAVAAGERKRLRNHKADCARCAMLPVRRARGLTGARAAAVMVAGAAAVALRRLIVTPAAEAMAAASAPAKTAAVVITAGTAAAGGVAIERPATHHRAAKEPAVTRAAAEKPATTPAAPQQRRTAPAVARPATPARRVKASTGSAPGTTKKPPASRLQAAQPPQDTRPSYDEPDRDESRQRASYEPRRQSSPWQHEQDEPQRQQQQPATESAMPQQQSYGPQQRGYGEQTRSDRYADGPGARW